MLTDNQFTVLMINEAPFPSIPGATSEEDLTLAAADGLAEKICVDKAAGEEWWRLTDKGRALIDTVDPEDLDIFKWAIFVTPRPLELTPDERVLAAVAQ